MPGLIGHLTQPVPLMCWREQVMLDWCRPALHSPSVHASRTVATCHVSLCSYKGNGVRHCFLLAGSLVVLSLSRSTTDQLGGKPSAQMDGKASKYFFLTIPALAAPASVQKLKTDRPNSLPPNRAVPLHGTHKQPVLHSTFLHKDRLWQL